MYSKQITSSLKNLVIFCRDVEKTAAFYTDAVGLRVCNQSKSLVELKDHSNLRILLKQVDSEAYNMKGYSPVMNFEVEDFQASVKKFEGYGAVQDGEIVDNEDYQMGLFKSPNGEMLCLTKTKITIESDDEDNQEESSTKTQMEIQNILKKIQF